MNTNLLLSKPTKNQPASFLLKSFLFMLPFLLGGLSEANAQCNGPYQYFESIPLNAATLTANGWINNVTSIPSGPSGAYSGKYAVVMNTAARFVQSPAIANPGIFSFYFKATVAAGYSFKVSYSSDPTFATSTQLGTNYTAAGITPYTKVTIDLAAAGVPANSYVRVSCLSTATMFIDDLAVTSTVASENTIIVPVTNSAANCNVNLASGMTYTFYDNGGLSDTHSPSQNNNITFIPAPGEQVELTFNSYNTGATATETIQFANTSPALPAYSGLTVPSPAVYLGTAADVSVPVNFTTTASTAPNTGFVITVKSKPPVATCSDVTAVSVTAATVTATTANVTFTPPIGTPPSGGYDYYLQTTATPAPVSGTTPSGNGGGSPITMSGLSTATTYYVWVRSNCGPGVYGNWVQAASTFTTKCSAYPVPYLENFNGLNGPLPTCTSADNPSAWATNIVNGNLFGNIEGTTFFTKPVALTAGTLYRLSYDYSTVNGIADFDVNYGTTNFTPSTSNINILLFSHSGVSTLSTSVINFTPSVTGTYYVGFTLQALDIPGSTQFNLDNVILEVETCVPPTGLTKSAVTSSSATISWTASTSAPASGYQYYVSTSNVTPDFSTPATGSVGAGITTTNLGGLTSGTPYYVWVRSNCSGHYSVWSSSVTFTTVVVVVTTVNMHDGASTGCNTYNFYDSGGSGGNYSSFEDYTYTFTPLAGKRMKVVFSSFSTEDGWDGLLIYNGNSTASPLLSSGLPAGFTAPAGSYYGTTSPGTIYSTAVDGSLTFNFTSDGSVVRPGWSATVTCVTVPVITSFTPTNNSCTSGTLVTITGSNFASPNPAVTSVAFNGIPAAFTVVNNTTITATLPAGLTTGLISVSNVDAVGYSITSFNTYLPPPVTTGVTICAGGSGSLSTTTTCQGYSNVGNNLSGNLNGATDPIANIPQTATSNSPSCNFTGTATNNYTAIQFQVSVTGSYQIEMGGSPTFDGMGYITTGAFTPGSCATGTYVVGDDDSGAGLFPEFSVNLISGVTYTLYTTVFGFANTTYTGPFTWTINSAPSGGQFMQYSNAQMEWYTVATGGTAIGSGTTFNPVGVAGSGLANTNTAGTFHYYAGCASNPNCRTLTDFVINAIPVAGSVSANQTICTGTQPTDIVLTGSTGAIQWQSSTDNISFANIPGQTTATLTGATIGILTAPKYFQAVLTSGSCGTATSTVVTVNVTPASVAGTVSADQLICPGNPPATITLSGNTGTIQWQSSTDNVTFGNIAGATSNTLTGAAIGTLSATTYFKAIVTNGVCGAATSPTVTVNVTPAIGGTSLPASQNVCSAISDLVLGGSVGTITKWQWATDAAFTTPNDIASSASTTLTAVQIGAFNGTQYYRAVISSGTCTAYSTTSVITYNSTTWSGSWSNGLPNSTTAAIFTGDYSNAGTLNACSVSVISGNVSFAPGGSLIVQNGVAVSGGTLTFDNNASLVQVNNASVNSGNIVYKRDTPMKQYDYTYWSSPVFPETLASFSPLTLSDKYFWWNTTIYNWESIAAPGTTVMTPGQGYIIRAPQNFTPAGATFNGQFTGIPNNGIIQIPIAISGANDLNLVGNPYPSAINADLFLSTTGPNANIIGGTIYLWTHNTPINPTQYTQSDYAVYNLVGGVGTGTAGGGTGNISIPNGKIASGEGFFVKGINSGGMATFNNSMRISGNNDQFFRMADINESPGSLEKHRIWLEIRNDLGAYKQTLVGYVESATNDRDVTFDGDAVDAGNVVGLYSVLGTYKLSIQGRALPFDVADQVPIGYSASIAGAYEIALSDFDGLFANQNIYLEDKVLNVIHNLKTGSYPFVTAVGTFDDRFILRYTDGTALGIDHPVFNENSVVVYKNDIGIYINTSNVSMSSVKIFDIRGRLIAEQKNIGSAEAQFTHLPEAQEILLVKITSEDGASVTKKVVY